MLHYVFKKYRVLFISLFWENKDGTSVWNVFIVLILLFGVTIDL